MQEKGVIQDIVPWRNARKTLYWRLRRLLRQDRVVGALLHVQPKLSVGQAESMLRRWFIEDKGSSEGYRWDDNSTVVQWLEQQEHKAPDQSIISYNIHCVKKDAVVNQIKESLEDCPDVALDTVVQIVQRLNDNQKAEVIRTLSQLTHQHPE